MAKGVDSADGSSEVKIVALEGEMRYFDVRVEMRASLKPIEQEREKGKHPPPQRLAMVGNHDREEN